MTEHSRIKAVPKYVGKHVLLLILELKAHIQLRKASRQFQTRGIPNVKD